MKPNKIIKTTKAKLKGFGKLPKGKLGKSEPLRPESVVSKNARAMEQFNTEWEYKVKNINVKIPNRWSEEDMNKFINPPNVLLVDMEETFKSCLDTAKKKNADYAGEDQVDPFKNFKNCVFLGVSVEQGILVRMMDKMSRVSNLLTQEAQVKDEAIEDTLADLVNYAAILKSYIKQKNIQQSITK